MWSALAQLATLTGHASMSERSPELDIEPIRVMLPKTPARCFRSTLLCDNGLPAPRTREAIQSIEMRGRLLG